MLSRFSRHRAPPGAALARRAVARLRHTVRVPRGNATLIFALAVIPLFGTVGVAVDYSRGKLARTAMQAQATRDRDHPVQARGFQNGAARLLG